MPLPVVVVLQRPLRKLLRASADPLTFGSLVPAGVAWTAKHSVLLRWVFPSVLVPMGHRSQGVTVAGWVK